jgi:hypothetical protein
MTMTVIMKAQYAYEGITLATVLARSFFEESLQYLCFLWVCYTVQFPSDIVCSLRFHLSN